MTAEVLAAIAELRDEVRALREEIAIQAPQDKRRQATKRRHALIRDLGRATGLGVTQAAATSILLMWVGAHQTPPECEHIVTALRREYETPLCMEQIWRVIKQT